jgi:hypothetical protein
MNNKPKFVITHYSDDMTKGGKIPVNNSRISSSNPIFDIINGGIFTKIILTTIVSNNAG